MCARRAGPNRIDLADASPVPLRYVAAIHWIRPGIEVDRNHLPALSGKDSTYASCSAKEFEQSRHFLSLIKNFGAGRRDVKNLLVMEYDVDRCDRTQILKA